MNLYHQRAARLWAGLAAGLLLATACAPDQQAPPTPTKTPLSDGLIAADSPTPSPVLFVTETPTPTMTLTPSATPIVSATPFPTETPELAPSWTPPPTQPSRAPSHNWLSRPIPEGFTNFVDRNYPYGSTSGGEFRVHHGYEFNNPRGTPIVAPAAGTVVYAGDDRTTQFGPETFFYGLLVVMQLDAVEPNSGEPLFLLFGHMDTIDVQQGEKVAADDVLGTVGNTGVALGAHLHFEVRVGDMLDYNATRNADLWLAPFLNFGTIAGRVVDGNGAPVYGVSITLQDQDGVARYTWTYEDDNVNEDNALGENFTRGDLPKGYYRIVFNNPLTGKKYEDVIYVEAHKTMWVEFVLDD